MLFEEDGASAEEDVGLNFGTLLDELLGVLELEVVVVVVGLRTETDLLDDGLDLLSLDFLLFLLLLVEELLVVEDTADWGIGGGGDLNEVEFHLVGQFHGVLDGEYSRVLDVLSYETHLRHTDFVVDPVFWFGLLRSPATLIVSAITAVASRTPIVVGGGIHYALRLLFVV